MTISSDNVREELKKIGICYDDVLKAVNFDRLDTYINDVEEMIELCKKEMNKNCPNNEITTNLLQNIYTKSIAASDFVNEGG